MKARIGLCLGLMLLTVASPLLWSASPAATLENAIIAVERGRYREALAQLTTLPMTALTPQDRHRARYLFAHAAQRLKRYPEALAAFGELVEYYAELGDYVLWNIARIYQDVNAERLYVEALKTLLKRFPDSRLAPQARLALGRQLIGMRGDLSEGVRILEDYLTQHGKEAAAPEAYWLLAQGYEGLGLANTALQTYRTLYIRFPASSEAEQVVPRIAGLGVPMPVGPGWFSLQERLERADQLAEAGQCERAIQEVQQAPSEAGPTDLAARSARRLGLCAFRLRRDREAIGAL